MTAGPAENGPAARAGRIVFSSDDLDPALGNKARMTQWHDIYTHNFSETEIRWEGEGDFRAHSEFVPFGDVVASYIDYNFHKVARTTRNLTSDTRENIIIGFMRDAPVRAKLGGREIDAAPNSIFSYSTARTVEFRTDAGRITGHCLVLPHSALRGHVAALDDVTGCLLAPGHPAVRLLGRQIELLVSSFADMPQGPLESHVRQTLVDLTALALGATGESAEIANMRGLRAARVQEVLRGIKAGFARPDFSPSVLARVLGVSPRYVHDLLQETGMTFSERVLDARLQKAQAMLHDRRNDRMRISDIALACGFGDVSYFNHRFRARYGAAPSDVRKSPRGQ